MNIALPAKFVDDMKQLLGSEYDNFMSSYRFPRAYGLRLNPLKIKEADWRAISPMADRIRPIPWTKDGFYYMEEDRPGRHPHYNAGLYYIQEPSAMSPVELLDAQPGHRVLDLCAAPGGKSTQIAGKLQGSGILVSNDNAFERTKALAKNIELAGVRNAIVLNEEPAALASVFEDWFDRILVDAPCSGEGMFRKDEAMAAAWEHHSIERCSMMQRDILSHAAKMLAPGGRLVYSTCTFNSEENETQIARFLAQHEDFRIVPAELRSGWSAGRPEWVDAETASSVSEEVLQSLAGTIRLWPHKLEGEGHFAAVLERSGSRPGAGQRLEEADAAFEAASVSAGGAIGGAGRPAWLNADAGGIQPDRKAALRRKDKGREDAKGWRSRSDGAKGRGGGPNDARKGGRPDAAELDAAAEWRRFCEEQLILDGKSGSREIAFGSRVYLQPTGMPSLDGLKIVRAGWFAGEAKRGRFEPAQPLAMGLKREEAKRSISWPADAEHVVRYLKGETLFVEQGELALQDGVEPKGYVLVCVDGYPLGWGKYAGGMLKNELSSGWRRL